MLLHAQPLLFEFEHQASENLTFIPMCVRFNLDRSALRLTLAQWQALPHAVRTRLACYALEPEVDHFARDLREQVAAAGAGELEAVTQAPDLQWQQGNVLPPAVAQQCSLHGVTTPSDSDWARLAEFQRYVLVKLSRRSTANHDFLSALREFGCLSRP